MDKSKKAEVIVKYARDLKKSWNTNDPYILASLFGFCVVETGSVYPGFTAQIIGIEGYPKIISINKAYTESSRRVLCAHELGHALLHGERTCNHFAGSSTVAFDNEEYEANLFAVALLTDEDINGRIAVPIEKMNNYLLKTILDYNIIKSE
jgi:Zn-dependent peptidase ImmA (M78 family)